MRQTVPATLLIFLISFNAFSGDVRGEKDPLAVSFIKNPKSKPDLVYQDQLRHSNGWENFLSAHSNWYVEFNESNQRPHRAFGKPIYVPGSTPVDVAKNFIENDLNSWNVSGHDLKFVSENFSGKYHNVFYSQTYKNLDVLFSRVFIKLTNDLRVITWGSDVFDIDISTDPAITPSIATSRADQGISGVITNLSIPVLKILPVPDGHQTTVHLVYEIIVSSKNINQIPSKYYTLVDANNGEILYRHNLIDFALPVTSDVHVESSVYEHNPYIPSVNVPMKDLRVDMGSNTYHTDSLGNITLNGGSSIHATFSLEGEWAKIVTGQSNVVASFDATFTGGNQTVTFDTVTTIRHLSGYNNVNAIHKFMKGYFPFFTRLDYPIITRIDVTNGTCNAFYDGNELNFYEAGGGCYCMSQVADIVYHEYGHGINDLFYDSEGSNFENESMGEGYADIWALSLTMQPVLGLGHDYNDPNHYLRRYDINPKVYPQDITGEPHDNGEIIAGAWYDVSQNLGWSSMTDLFVRTFYDLVTGSDGDEGIVYSDILLAALLEDDNDNDITNGTPHDLALIYAFEAHGITLLNNADIVHDEILSSPAQNDITVRATVVQPYPWYLTGLSLNYRTDSTSAFTTIPMTLLSDTFVATIPQQNSGTIISYFLTLTDSTGSPVKTLPLESGLFDSNIPFYIIVGGVSIQVEDFDQHQSPGWLLGISGDDATKGMWVIDDPVASFKDGDTCQTGVQHTSGGTSCAVTGNATSTSTAYNVQDVDDGKTTLQSPTLSLNNVVDPVVSYWRWYTNDQGQTPRTDFWRTYVSDDGVNFTLIENTNVADHSWRRKVFRVSDYFPNANSIMLRFVAEDLSPSSLIEAAVDDIEIEGMDVQTGITTLNENDFSIYPNPASDELNFNVDFPGKNFSMIIYNSLGKEIFSKQRLQAGQNRITLDKFADGIYTVVLKNETGKSISSRFVISK